MFWDSVRCSSAQAIAGSELCHVSTLCMEAYGQDAGKDQDLEVAVVNTKIVRPMWKKLKLLEPRLSQSPTSFSIFFRKRAV